MTGMLAVMPWFPLPLLLMAGRVLPAIRASEAAAVRPMAKLRKSSPKTSCWFSRMVFPTFMP